MYVWEETEHPTSRGPVTERSNIRTPSGVPIKDDFARFIATREKEVALPEVRQSIRVIYTFPIPGATILEALSNYDHAEATKGAEALNRAKVSGRQAALAHAGRGLIR